MKNILTGITLRFIEYVESLSKTSVLSMVVFFSMAVGLLDNITGEEVSLAPLYLFPVLLSAWKLGKTSSLIVAFLESLILNLSNYGIHHHFSHNWILIWNITFEGISFSILAYLASELHEQNLEVKQASMIDSLTGALNRRAFYQALEKEVFRSNRIVLPLSLVYIDIDNFKHINDHYGHKEGDQVLIKIVSIFLENLRHSDIIGRLGGDEFVILFPETDSIELREILPRIVNKIKIGLNDLTLSIGAITCDNHFEDIDRIIQQADNLMYQVKHSSKDAIQYLVI